MQNTASYSGGGREIASATAMVDREPAVAICLRDLIQTISQLEDNNYVLQMMLERSYGPTPQQVTNGKVTTGTTKDPTPKGSKGWVNELAEASETLRGVLNRQTELLNRLKGVI